ncbi:MAG: tetratricopeptide repeat protein, partial [Candidatus Staskawiczbacteria bacterium]|nr:tetratricopeptide repeat protein [Candidatus Staskawiczbacteria bacterium]
ISDADTWALSSYDTALQLDPNNPYLYMQEGNVNYLSKQFATAQTKLEKSVALNPNYSNALYSLGLVYDATGHKDKAIEQFTKVQQLNPKDTTISKILANLKAGLPALQSPTPPTETPPANSSMGETSTPAEENTAPTKK